MAKAARTARTARCRSHSGLCRTGARTGASDPQGGWLFANRQGTRPIDITVAQKLYTMAKLRKGIAKQCGIHALRHAAFAPCSKSAPICLRSRNYSAIGTSQTPRAICTSYRVASSRPARPWIGTSRPAPES